MCKELVHIGGNEPNTQKDAKMGRRERHKHTHTPGGTRFLVPIPDSPESTLTRGFLMLGFTALFLQTAPIAFQ